MSDEILQPKKTKSCVLQHDQVEVAALGESTSRALLLSSTNGRMDSRFNSVATTRRSTQIMQENGDGGQSSCFVGISRARVRPAGIAAGWIRRVAALVRCYFESAPGSDSQTRVD